MIASKALIVVSLTRRLRFEDWRRGSESNRRIKVLQTSPLPLGYRASLKEPRSFAVLRISPAGSDARKTAQLGYGASLFVRVAATGSLACARFPASSLALCARSSARAPRSPTPDL